MPSRSGSPRRDGNLPSGHDVCARARRAGISGPLWPRRRPVSCSTRIIPGLVLSAALASGALASAQQFSYDGPPINYSKSKPADPIADFQARIAADRATLTFEGPQGYLRSLLKEL